MTRTNKLSHQATLLRQVERLELSSLLHCAGFLPNVSVMHLLVCESTHSCTQIAANNRLGIASKGCFATTKSEGHSLPENQRQQEHINIGVGAHVSFVSWLGMK